MHEAIDNEVVIVDFESGNYYSLEDVGASIWTALAGGAGIERIVASIESAYDCDGVDVLITVAKFVEELLENELLATTDLAPTGDALPAQNGSIRRAFTPPVLNRYTDMQELLLLDPIHDVDETGWPNLPVLETVDQ
ncbi:MAG: PqqD family protein [Caldilineales bacterium]|nr:PqqD family protein [Caldilineales bacterium]